MITSMKCFLPLLLATQLHAWQPVPDSMLTEWGEKLKPESTWQEYPRPSLKREKWINLNGLWNYAITPNSENSVPTSWSSEILVPFAIEAPLSGVGELLKPNEALWYQRSFLLDSKSDGRLLLHFEAVDYQATVWLNETKLGEHVGGNLPFSFDITELAKQGENAIVLKVIDRTDAQDSFQLTGKQKLVNKGIFYTRVSGIWQTVWLEEVPENFIRDLKITTKTDGTIHLDPDVVGTGKIRTEVHLNGAKVAEGSDRVKVPNPKLWSPDSPTLYDLTVTLADADGNVLDRITSYAGIREFGKTKDEDGHWLFTLNGKPIFHWGPLDQGWWPDGLLTPPSEDAMLYELGFLKKAGFNMIRKHIKIEPRRYYYHCDRMGFLVWQDQVSGGKRPKWHRLDPARNKNHDVPKAGDPIDAEWPDAAHEQWMSELKGMIDHLGHHPSIAVWVPFNEAWGQHRTMEVGKWIVKYDPSRLINIASGGNWAPVGDVADMHSYPHPAFPFHIEKFNDYVKVVGEFGGHGWKVDDHVWDEKKKHFIYGGMPKDLGEFQERYEQSITKLTELEADGVAAGVYTQTSDVEGEINGLLTYDRKVAKIPASNLKKVIDDSRLLASKSTVYTGMNIPDIGMAPVAKAMSRAEIEAGLKSHDRALFIKEGWIRDPYITMGPDDFYYLTGTTINPDDPREENDPYNVGLGEKSAVGNVVQVWKSKDLIDWDYLGTPYTLKDSPLPKPGDVIWAPELHWIPELNRWALVHCPSGKSVLTLTEGPELKGPWSYPMGRRFTGNHDPSLYHDNDQWWVLSGNTNVQKLSPDFTEFQGTKKRIDPSGERPDPSNPDRMINRIGHEGATMIKVGDQYVHLGTAWSTDQGRQGSYNLYYSTSDKLDGSYGPRKFAGRFLGHGTPFQTRDGKWWCTAFFNANVPPLPREGIQSRDLAETAQTINQRGTTIVPLEVEQLDNGEIYIRAKDPDYATPGPDEAQSFNP